MLVKTLTMNGSLFIFSWSCQKNTQTWLYSKCGSKGMLPSFMKETLYIVITYGFMFLLRTSEFSPQAGIVLNFLLFLKINRFVVSRPQSELCVLRKYCV